MKAMIKISKITYFGTQVEILGLNELLSDSTLWTEPAKETNRDYIRKVLRENGKTTTILRRVKNA